MELLIDPEIRQWVFLPIVLLTFLVDMVRYYVAIIVSIENKPNLMQIQDSQTLLRARLVRENGGYLTKESFYMRKVFFNHNETGYFKCHKRSAPYQNTSSMLNDMLKGNLVNVLPMVLVGGWINWMFSGFVTTRVPFPLTLRFKPMLQRGIELAALDASWVSSASWYFLNVFGLRSIYSLVLDTDYDFDWTQRNVDVINMAAITMTQDTRSAFKAEWEALELTTHCDELCHAMREVMASAIIFAYFQ